MAQPSETRPSTEPRRVARRFLLAAGLSGGVAGGATTLVNLHVERNRAKLGLKERPLDCRKRMMDSFRVRPTMCDPDSILLGSSRTKMLRDVRVGDHVFTNMSCDDMVPAEFDAFIRFFEDHCGKRPEVIILAMDFFGSSQFRKSVPSPPKYYMDRGFSLIHKLGLYDVISVDTTVDSARALGDPAARAQLTLAAVLGTAREKWFPNAAEVRRRRSSLDWGTKRFMRDANDRDCLIPRVFEARQAGLINAGENDAPYPHRQYYAETYANYELDERNREVFRRLRIDHRDIQFAPLLTPVTNVLFTELVDTHGLLDELEVYTRMIVEELGSVTTFMDVGSVTSARRNWRDENHLLPQAGDLMLLRATGVEHPDMPADFGTLVTAENADAYFDDLRARLDGPRVPRSPRVDASIASVRYDQLAAKHRPPGWHWRDCTALIRPNGPLRIEFDEPVVGRTKMDVSWTMDDTIDLRFFSGAREIEVVRLQRPDSHYGLTVMRTDLSPSLTAGFDRIDAVLAEGDGKGGLGHLKFD